MKIKFKSHSPRELSASAGRRVSWVWSKAPSAQGARRLHREEDRCSGEESSKARARGVEAWVLATNEVAPPRLGRTQQDAVEPALRYRGQNLLGSVGGAASSPTYALSFPVTIPIHYLILWSLGTWLIARHSTHTNKYCTSIGTHVSSEFPYTPIIPLFTNNHDP